MHFKNILLLLILSCIVIRWIGVIFLFVVVLLVLKTGPYKKDKNRVNVEGKWEYMYEFVKGYNNNLIELSYRIRFIVKLRMQIWFQGKEMALLEF